MKRLLLLGICAAAVAHAQENYVGAQRCKTCHEFEFQVWQSSGHASSLQSLSESQQKDPKCNTCHTMLSGSEKKEFLGVQCERCHGPGKYYHQRFVMKDKELARAVGLLEVKQEHCAQCHNESAPNLRPFDYAAMWAKIDHSATAKVAFEQGQTLGR